LGEKLAQRLSQCVVQGIDRPPAFGSGVFHFSVHLDHDRCLRVRGLFFFLFFVKDSKPHELEMLFLFAQGFFHEQFKGSLGTFIAIALFFHSF